MSQPAVRVWATSDGVRVNPETGRYLEDRPDIHADYPGGEYPSRNAVWDDATGRITLHAGRNEFVAFQVIVAVDAPISDISVRFTHLVGPKGAEISGRCVALFKAWSAHVTRISSGYQDTSLGPAWYPDALLPVPTGQPLLFDIPDRDHKIGPRQRNQSMWIDLFVPRDADDAPPGLYRGKLTVSWPGGGRNLDVELTVWNFALPDEIHCHGDIYNRSLLEMSEEQELGYYHMAHRHRFHPGVPAYRPEIQVDDTEVSIDWTRYDARLRKYFDGSAFTDASDYWGPGVSTPIPHIILPFDIDKVGQTGRAWPIPLPPTGQIAAYEAVWVETARQFKAHFDADPTWNKVRKIAFLDGLDESYDEAAYKKMRYYCDLLRRGVGEDWLQFRIDGGYSWEAMDSLQNHVDLWVCHTVGFDAEKMAHFRQRGVEPWFYGPMIYEREANSACGSNTFTDLDLLTCRSVGWVAWKLDCGYCEWEFDAYWDSQNHSYDPEKNWTNALNFRHQSSQFNGSGLLIYRGRPRGLDAPLPSIRLKAHRRGFQDYEYLWMLTESGQRAAAERISQSVIHGEPFGQAYIGNIEIWKNDPEAWLAARLQAGELLSENS